MILRCWDIAVSQVTCGNRGSIMDDILPCCYGEHIPFRVVGYRPEWVQRTKSACDLNLTPDPYRGSWQEEQVMLIGTSGYGEL